VTFTRLPNKLSSLLRVAIEDSKAVQRRKNVSLNMTLWVESDNDGWQVCMAGAVMLRRIPRVEQMLKTYDCVYPEELSDSLCKKLLAINEMREGRFDYALRLHGFRPDEKQSNALNQASHIVRSDYVGSVGRAPWKTYTRAISILKKAGL